MLLFGVGDWCHIDIASRHHKATVEEIYKPPVLACRGDHANIALEPWKYFPLEQCRTASGKTDVNNDPLVHFGGLRRRVAPDKGWRSSSDIYRSNPWSNTVH